MSADFFMKAQELSSKGLPFVTAFIVRAEKPTSAKPGDKAIITADGALHGWIGGSCAQPTVIREALKALKDGEPRLLRLNTDPPDKSALEGLIELPMTCFSGGTLEIYIEPQLPTPRLMVIGSLPIAQTLSRLGKVMHYQVSVVDPDSQGKGMPEADEVITELDKISASITPLTYVVVASHGNYDEAALERALRSKAAYVALVASKRRSAAVLEYLAAQGLTSEELARLKYPAGLDIQAHGGDEIALSIMTEIVQRRNAVPVNTQALQAQPAPILAEALDPVCGMSVQVEGAEHFFEYKGQTYYFCCPGCKGRFKKNPTKFLTQQAPTGEATDPVCGMTVEIASARYMSEYEGTIYYFCAAGCKLAFDKAPLDYKAITNP